MTRVRLRVDGYAARRDVVSALAESGYSVKVVEKQDSLTSQRLYYVVFEVPNGATLLIGPDEAEAAEG